MELLLFYKLTFITSILSSSSLSLIGFHQFTRHKIFEIFALSQFVLIGNLISKILFHDHEGLLFSFFICALFFVSGKVFISSLKIRKSHYEAFMIGIYLILTSAQQLLIGLYPSLDSHMNTGFFGNIVTASNSENVFLIFIFALFHVAYYLCRKTIQKQTLEISIFQQGKTTFIEQLIFYIPLVSSLYGLGFLYTLSFLLIPALLIGRNFNNQSTAFKALVIISSLASSVGLYSSIVVTGLSTTATQITLLVVTLLLVKVIKERKLKF